MLNNLVCDEEIINQPLQFNIDQVAMMWIYIWGRIAQDEKDFIIYLLENNGASRLKPDNELGHVKSSISRFIDSLSNQGIIEFSKDKMLATWLRIKYETNGFYPL